MSFVMLLLAGLVIGLLGKLVAPNDKDNIPLWATEICGVLGVIVGYMVYAAFGGNGSAGVDWVRWIVAVITAAVFVMLASTMMSRNHTRRR